MNFRIFGLIITLTILVTGLYAQDSFSLTDSSFNEINTNKIDLSLSQVDNYDNEGGIPVLVGIQPGIYLAHKAPANYYNGTAEDYNGFLIIDNIFTNPESRRDIMDVTGLSDSQLENSRFEFNYNMNYDIGFLIGFQSYFGISKRMWMMLDINFVQLNTASIISLLVNDPNLPNQDVTQLPVHGQEQRFYIDLGAHWILGKRDLKGYIETGGNFLSAKVKNNEFDVLNQFGDVALTYSLLPTSLNTAANTITSYTFGGFLGGGIFYNANDKMGIEAGFQIGFNEVILPQYNGYFPNYIFSLRFIYLGQDNEM